MKVSAKRALAALLLLAAVFCLCACNNYSYAAQDEVIIDAADLGDYIGQSNVVVVDMRSAEEYAAGHVEGAVNISLEQIMISVPVENMLTSPAKLKDVLIANGIGDDTIIVAYDGNKMTASRFAWSLMVYGNFNARVVSGGFAAIEAAGYALSTQTPAVTASAGITLSDDKDAAWYVNIKEMQALVNEPQEGIVLLDTRTDQEYLDEGKIPGSMMMDYIVNFYSDGTFKDTVTTKIDYLQAGLDPDKEIIIYCRTSMRAAPVFIRLYDAGYRNIRIYDGAWLEWSSNSNNPVEYAAAGAPAATKKDAS